MKIHPGSTQKHHWHIHCPACGRIHHLVAVLKGEVDSPTFERSFGFGADPKWIEAGGLSWPSAAFEATGVRRPTNWCIFTIADGKLIYSTASGHGLAGQTVEMVHLPYEDKA
jgi:hypothetical protein